MKTVSRFLATCFTENKYTMSSGRYGLTFIIKSLSERVLSAEGYLIKKDSLFIIFLSLDY